MNETISKFVNRQASLLNRRTLDIFKEESEAVGQLYGIAWSRRGLYHQCKSLLELVKANPEIKDSEDYSSADTAAISYYVSDYEKHEKESPVSKLLNWSSLTGPADESFVLSQIYDILGKDDARTFRSLLREVVMLADPKLAGDI